MFVAGFFSMQRNYTYIFISGYMHLHFRLPAFVLLSIFYLLCYHVLMQVVVAYNNTKPWSIFRLQLFFLFALLCVSTDVIADYGLMQRNLAVNFGSFAFKVPSRKRILIQYSSLNRLRRVHVSQNWIGNMRTCESDHVDGA